MAEVYDREKGWKGRLRAAACSLATIAGSTCFAFTIYWVTVSNHAFTSHDGPIDFVGNTLEVVSGVTLAYSLVIAPFDFKRALIGIVGSGVGLLATMTALYKVA